MTGACSARANTLAAAVTAACALAPSFVHAYRTGSDLPELDDLPPDAVVRWHGPIELELHEDGLPGLDDEVLDALERAAGSWSRPQCGAVEFAKISTTDIRAEPDDGHSTIEAIAEGWTDRGLDTGPSTLSSRGFDGAARRRKATRSGTQGPLFTGLAGDSTREQW